jgi:photosystem II stability/assembly factor-like uncharacterized protein
MTIGRGLLLASLAGAWLAVHAAAASARPVALRWLEMTDTLHGFALAGAGSDVYRLLRTDDGGRVWTDVTPQSARPSGPVAVESARTVLLPANLRTHVFAVARTDDGGRSWHLSAPFRDNRGLGLGAPDVIDARHAVVAVDEGAAAGSQGQALYASSDGGRTWRFVSRTQQTGRSGALPFGCDKNGFAFATPTRGLAGGVCAGGAAFLYRTGDGGRTWHRVALPGLSACQCDVSPRFFSPKAGAIVAAGFTTEGRPLVHTYWTDDGGADWRPSPLPVGRASTAVSSASASTLWLVGTPPGRIRSPFTRLVRTDDAGRSWHASSLPFDADGFQLDALDAATAYAVSPLVGRTSVLRTVDGGRTWQTIRTTVAR